MGGKRRRPQTSAPLGDLRLFPLSHLTREKKSLARRKKNFTLDIESYTVDSTHFDIAHHLHELHVLLVVASLHRSSGL